MDLRLGDCIDVLKTLPANHVQTCITSPPYWGLRDYGVDGQIGLEISSEVYVAKMVAVFREVRRVLKDDGTLWINLGDCYSTGSGGHNAKPKDLIGIPWLVAFALRDDGWYLRQDIIWHKPNAMPESIKDRCSKSHEYIFMFSKSPKYYYDNDAIREPYSKKSLSRYETPMANIGLQFGGRKPGRQWVAKNEKITPNPKGRNKRSVWTVTVKAFKDAHFATYPPDLIEPCVLAGSPKGGVVLDPFAGAGTTGLVALKHGRGFIGCELNPDYLDIARKRLTGIQGELKCGT